VSDPVRRRNYQVKRSVDFRLAEEFALRFRGVNIAISLSAVFRPFPVAIDYLGNDPGEQRLFHSKFTDVSKLSLGWAYTFGLRRLDVLRLRLAYRPEPFTHEDSYILSVTGSYPARR